MNIIISVIQILFLLLALNSCTKEGTTEAITTPDQKTDTSYALPGWALVWNDEFNGNVVDSNKWNYEVNGSGGGNNELQYYTDRYQNSYVDSLKLLFMIPPPHKLEQKLPQFRMSTHSFKIIRIRSILPQQLNINYQ